MKKFLLKFLSIIIYIIVAVSLITIAFNLISLPSTILNVIGIAILSVVCGIISYTMTIFFSKKK